MTRGERKKRGRANGGPRRAAHSSSSFRDTQNSPPPALGAGPGTPGEGLEGERWHCVSLFLFTERRAEGEQNEGKRRACGPGPLQPFSSPPLRRRDPPSFPPAIRTGASTTRTRPFSLCACLVLEMPAGRRSEGTKERHGAREAKVQPWPLFFPSLSPLPPPLRDLIPPLQGWAFAPAPQQAARPWTRKRGKEGRRDWHTRS